MSWLDAAVVSINVFCSMENQYNISCAMAFIWSELGLPTISYNIYGTTQMWCPTQHPRYLYALYLQVYMCSHHPCTWVCTYLHVPCIWVSVSVALCASMSVYNIGMYIRPTAWEASYIYNINRLTFILYIAATQPQCKFTTVMPEMNLQSQSILYYNHQDDAVNNFNIFLAVLMVLMN